MSILSNVMKKLGYYKAENNELPRDIHSEENFISIYKACRPFTMTSVERMFSLYNATKYISENKIAGDIVECGVWKGGSSMVIAKTLLLLNDYSRTLYLYDTFEGMSTPTKEDVDINNSAADKLLEVADKGNSASIWCYSTIDEVQANLKSTGYDRLKFIKGKVEDTLPGTIPGQIALLRLDTDWFNSTYHELLHLYPLIAKGGVILIDDYGHWQGARKAVDQYFSEHNLKPLMHRIDYTGRIFQKI